MFERFTPSARRVVVEAQEICREFGHDAIRSDQFLLAVVRTDEGSGAALLKERGMTEVALAAHFGSRPLLEPDEAEALASIGIAVDEVERRAEDTFGEGALRRGRPAGGHIPFAREAKKGLEQALRECIELGSRDVTVDHVLLGMLHPAGHAATMVRALGHDPDELRRRLRGELGEAA